jgi:hypothetical protein
MVLDLGDAERFLLRAKELRATAYQIEDPNSRDVIVRAAEDYERRAARIRSGLQNRYR